VQVFVTKLRDDAVIPTYAHYDDAGMDLYAVDSVCLPARDRIVISTGIAIALPEGFVGLVHPRSGMAFKQGITVLNTPGTIDAGYRGEIKVVLYNSTDNNYNISAGARIAQLVIQQYHKAIMVELTELPEAVRGYNGFGSSGS